MISPDLVKYHENGSVLEELFYNREDELPDSIIYYETDEVGEKGPIEEEKYFNMPVSSIAYYRNGDVSCICKNGIYNYYQLGEFNPELYSAILEENKIILRRI